MQASLSERQLVRHSAWTLLQQLVGAGASLATSVMLARMLGPSGQGLYGVVATTALLGGMCINLGTPAATTYAVSRRQITPLRALGQAGLITFCLGGAGALLIGLGAWLRPQMLWPAVPFACLVWACAIIPALLAAQLLAAILQGAHAFARYNKMALVSPWVTFASSFVVLRFGGGVPGALGCLLLGQLSAVAWGIGSIRRLVQQEPAAPGGASEGQGPSNMRHLLGFGAMAALANALAYGSYRVDIFLLSAWLPQEATGYYSVAASIAERLWLLSGAVSMVLFAQVARSQAAEPAGPPQNYTPMLVRHVLGLAALCGLALHIVSPWALPLLFGARYVQSIAPLAALLPGVVIFNVARVLSQDFAGRGLVRINVCVGAGCLGLNVLGCVLLIPKYGAVGAAWASTLSYSADSAVKLVIYTRLTHTPWRLLLLLQPEDLARLRQRRP